MPYIRIELSSGRTIEQKRKAAAAITDAMVRELGCTRESVSLVFSDVDDHDWAAGGNLLSDVKAARSASSSRP
jgi:4-oxalocrotonate tautomerase